MDQRNANGGSASGKGKAPYRRPGKAPAGEGGKGKAPRVSD